MAVKCLSQCIHTAVIMSLACFMSQSTDMVMLRMSVNEMYLHIGPVKQVFRELNIAVLFTYQSIQTRVSSVQRTAPLSGLF